MSKRAGVAAQGFRAGKQQPVAAARLGPGARAMLLRRVSGRANDTIYFCAQQRSTLLEPCAEPRGSSRGDGHRPVLLPCRKRRKAGVATAFPHLILRANGSV